MSYRAARRLMFYLRLPPEIEFTLGYVPARELAQRCRSALVRDSDQRFLKGDEGTTTKIVLWMGWNVVEPGIPPGFYESCIRRLLAIAERYPHASIHFG